MVVNYEPIAWAEELIEPARAVNHPRLATLYMLASQCYWTGRIEEAVGYADAGQTVIGSGGEVPFGGEGTLGAVYMAIGQPERTVEWCRAQLARGRDTHTFTRSMLVTALAVAGAGEEARAAANGLIEAAEATHNPQVLANALYAYGYAFGDADPVRALEALRRGLVIAQDSGNRLSESLLATVLSRLEAEHGDPLAALDHITLAIRNFYDSGNVAYIRFALATLAVAPRPPRTPRTGSHHRRFRIQSLNRVDSPPTQHSDHPPARCARRPDLRIARPQGRDDDHRRHGDLRIRPNRPGPSRTERCLEIDEFSRVLKVRRGQVASKQVLTVQGNRQRAECARWGVRCVQVGDNAAALERCLLRIERGGRLVSRHGSHLAMGVGSVRSEVLVGVLRDHVLHTAVEPI